ncbi:FAD-binding oxidoreductase [Estrella lausannensis]|uniref:FAD linked oxidase n=1 Tax=Estrella lausannensis TaxID=483423 RepID=A0A0H5DSE4_9BACT|nr:FAD-binding oxidoreductase [Estrella lausannensis]CRX39213.1 FAD linked oxidase [Estrella lausannensis]
MGARAINVHGELAEISDAALNELRMQLKGKVILPVDLDYDEVRKVWNGMIDQKPALIIRSAGVADVIYAVRFAKKFNLLISVRGAGHNIAGRALHDDALLIDLSEMRAVFVDPVSKTLIASPGATLADIDHETQVYGLALPLGINSTTGISGLALGGGFGWLSRSLGLTSDNLLSAEVVTVEGERIVCDSENHPDLFWGLSGGGGNFGIVTSFKFRLHSVGPMLFCGPVVFSMKEGKEVLQKYRDFCKECPEELTVWAVLRHAPPFPFIDAKNHGNPVIILVGVYNGPVDQGEECLVRLKSFGTALGDGLGPAPFEFFQKAFDPMLTPGARNYWKSHNFIELSDDLIDTLLQYAATLPSKASEIFIGQMGGKTNAVEKDSTAYPHRDVNFIMNVHTRWIDKVDDEPCIQWARLLYEEAKPFSSGGVYVNFVSEGDDNVQGAYLQNARRLRELKLAYDPENILRFNLNIVPR